MIESGEEHPPPTVDRLLGGRVILSQPASGYRAAIDPVLLAAAAPVKPGDRVIDLGCGVGAAALCLIARVPEIEVVGLELQPDLAAHARANAVANGVCGHMAVIVGDVAALPLATARFDHAIANPPYLPQQRSSRPPDRSKALAHQEDRGDLAGWIRGAHALLRPRGWLTLIHRADRLDEICASLRPRFAGVTILPLWPRTDRAARRVIIRARRDTRTPATLAPGLVLHEADGSFTQAADAVLRDAAALA